MTLSPPQDERVVPLVSPRTGLLRRWLRQSWIVALGAAVGLAVAAALTTTATPEYSSRASLQFSLAYSTSATDINQGSAYTRSEMLSYAELASSATILQPVLRELELDLSPAALASRISVTTPPDTSVLHIAVTDETPRQAASIANAVAASVSRYAVSHSPVDEELGPLIGVTTIASASTPTSPSSPRLTVNLAAGLLLGLFAGVLVAMARLRADTRLRTVQDIAAVTDAPVLGTIGGHRHSHAARPGEVSDSVRRIAAALRHSLAVRPAAVMVVTPVAAGAHALSLAEQIAASLSATGHPSAVLDGTLARHSASERDDGTADGAATGERRTDADAITDHEGTRLHTLGAAVDERRAHCDTVLLAAPSIAASADAAILGSLSADALIIVHARTVRAEHLLSALRELAAAGLAPRGIILDEARLPHGGHRAAEAGAEAHGHAPSGSALGRLSRPAPQGASGGKAQARSLQRG
jgi:succinoglycan biosynthesis transport protein ExoP